MGLKTPPQFCGHLLPHSWILCAPLPHKSISSLYTTPHNFFKGWALTPYNWTFSVPLITDFFIEKKK